MTSVIKITRDEKLELREFHEDFGRKARLAAYSTAAAAFLLIGALIVITCGCLCLTLPGVNVINHVILPAVIPGIFGIILSIPLILLAVKQTQDKNYYREQMINRMVTHLESYQIPEKERKMRVKFILKNFLNWQKDPHKPGKLIKNSDWTAEYQGKVLGEIKEKIGNDKKDRNPRQEKIATALDKARAKINKK